MSIGKNVCRLVNAYGNFQFSKRQASVSLTLSKNRILKIDDCCCCCHFFRLCVISNKRQLRKWFCIACIENATEITRASTKYEIIKKFFFFQTKWLNLVFVVDWIGAVYEIDFWCIFFYCPIQARKRKRGNEKNVCLNSKLVSDW